MQLVIDSTGLEKYAKQLNEINRSAYPVAVRQTLNSAAFDVKQRTMPDEAKDTFTQRKPNFFKANSKVEKAQGFAINTMQSTVGFTGNQQAVEDLEQQEHGGKIKGRSFIPLDTARTGGSNKRMIRANARLKKLKFVDPKNVSGKNEKEKFIKSVEFAGRGGLVLGEYKGRKIIWRVNSLRRNEDGQFKLTALYTYDKGRAAKIDKATHFMRTASLESAKLLNDHFIKNAEAQILKNAK